jgi:hypothetical protein
LSPAEANVVDDSVFGPLSRQRFERLLPPGPLPQEDLVWLKRRCIDGARYDLLEVVMRLEERDSRPVKRRRVERVEPTPWSVVDDGVLPWT